jgi:hypothetical protein
MRIFLIAANLTLALALTASIAFQSAQAGARGKGGYNNNRHYSGGNQYYRYKPRKRVQYGFKKETVNGRDTYVVRPYVSRRGDRNDTYRQNTNRKLIQTTRPKVLGE